MANGWAPIIDPVVPLIGLISGIILALAAGLYPARKAAQLDPTVTLSGT